MSTNVDETQDSCTVGGLGCDPDMPAQTWWMASNLEKDKIGDMYVASLYWAFTTMTTVGYGDITPQNDAERVYAIICMIVGATVFGYIIGSIAALAGMDSGADSLTKRKLALVQDFCEEGNLCKLTQDAVHRHYKFVYSVRSPYHEADIPQIYQIAFGRLRYFTSIRNASSA